MKWMKKRWDMQQLPGFEAIEEPQGFDGVLSPQLRPTPPIPPKPKIMTLTDEDLNRYLNNKESLDILKDFDVILPSELKDASLSEIQYKMDKASKEITEQASKKKKEHKIMSILKQ